MNNPAGLPPGLIGGNIINADGATTLGKISTRQSWVGFLGDEDTFDESIAELIDESIQVDLVENDDGDYDATIHFPDGSWTGVFQD